MHDLKRDAIEMKRALLQGLIGDMAAILDRSWTAKKATAAGISNHRIDEIYALPAPTARSAARCRAPAAAGS